MITGRLRIVMVAACALAAAACEPPAARGPEPLQPAGSGPGASTHAVMAAPAPPASAPVAAPRVPTASRRQLASGANVAIVENRDAPRVAIRLAIAAGTSCDTERAGASVVAAHAMSMSIADRVGALGAGVGVVMLPDAAVFSIDVAPDVAGAAIELLAELTRGAAPQAPFIARATRRTALEAKRLAAEDDEHVAAYVIVRDVYDLPTARHPYGTASATAAEIADVTAVDVRAIVGTRYVAAASSLVVVGDVAASEAMVLAERAFAGASPKPLMRLDLTEPFARDHDRVTLADRPGLGGAHVMIGLVGPFDPDPVALADPSTLAAIELAVEVVAARLGGDAAAKVYAFDGGPHVARLDLRTSPQRAAAEVRRVQSEIEQIASVAPSADEIATAKRRLLGRAARALATIDGVADALAARGAAAGVLERKLGALAAASPQVVSIAAQSLARAKAHVVVSADAKIAAEDLTSIAEVKVVDPLADYARLRSVQARR